MAFGVSMRRAVARGAIAPRVDVFVAVAGAMALTMLRWGVLAATNSTPSPVLTLSYVVLCGMVIAALLLARVPAGMRIVEVYPWFLSMSFLYLIVRPVVLLTTAADQSTDLVGFVGINTPTHTILTASYWGTVGICAFVSVYGLRRWDRRGLRWSRAEVGALLSQPLTRFVIGGLLLAGMLARIYLVNLKGGVMAFQDTRGLDNAGLGPIWYTAGLTLSGCTLYLWAVMTGWIRRSRTIDLLVLLSVPTILFINSRGGFLLFALGFVFLVWNAGRRRLFLPLVISAFIVAVSWGPIRGQISGQATREAAFVPDFSDADALDRFTVSNLSLGVTDMFWLVVTETPGTANFQYGRILLGAFLDNVPRAIWPSKPLTGSNYFMQVFFPDQTSQNSLGPGFFGILYLEGGPFAIILGCCLLAAVSRVSFVAATASKRPTWPSLFYLLFFPAAPAMMQGGLYVMIMAPLLTGLPMVLLIMVLTRRAGHRSTGLRPTARLSSH
jgi:hypothetical protein